MAAGLLQAGMEDVVFLHCIKCYNQLDSVWVCIGLYLTVITCWSGRRLLDAMIWLVVPAGAAPHCDYFLGPQMSFHQDSPACSTQKPPSD